MAAPLILRIITDATQTLKATSAVSTSFTTMGRSALLAGEDINKAAKTAVINSVRVEESIAKEAAAYRELSTSASLTAKEQVKAAQLAEVADAKLARSQGLVVGGMRGTSTAAKTAENDLGKLTRGALAGSGVISSLGRSLAFASTGFIAVAGTATLLHNAITEALAYAATEKQVTAQLKTSGLSFDTYKGQIEDALTAESKLSGFTRNDLLQSFGYLVRVSGNVGQSLNLDSVAADVARGRHIALASASIALAKALGGSSTALRRLGIIVPKTATGMDAIRYVAAKFAGQAEAGATSADHLHASLANASEVIGTDVLPTFNRLATEFSNYISKLDASGRLQKDANEAVTLLGYGFHTLGAAIKFVDDMTGGFVHTLEILIALELGSKILSWGKALRILAGEWGLVGAAATKAAAAEEVAVTEGAAGGAAGGAAAGATGGLLSGGLLGALATKLRYGRPAGAVGRIGAYTGGEAAVAGEAGAAAGVSATGVGALAVAAVLATDALGGLAKQINDAAGGGNLGDSIIGGIEGVLTGGLVGNHRFGILGQVLHGFANPFAGPSGPPQPPPQTIQQQQQALGITTNQIFGPPPSSYPFGVKPMQQFWKQWEEGFKLQRDELMAALTKSNADDIATARKIVAKIKKQIDEGVLSGPALTQALQAEANALGIIWAAEATAAQKRATAAAAAKQKIITQIQNAIDPINLQIAFAKADALGGNTTAVLRKQLAAAYNGLAEAIANGNKQLILAAYQQIKSLKDAIKAAATTASKTFTEPMKLQIAFARAQAFGGDTTDILKRMKAAAMKALKSGKYTGQSLIDLLNEIANINSQLDSSVTNAYGDYKKASVKALTAGQGLSAAQRRELEARLSRVGPGGTTPEMGTGAAGYIIDPTTGRPVHIGHHNRRRRLQGASDYSSGTGPYKEEITVKVFLDGKVLAASTTVHQQRYRRGNPSSRRGPNAGNSTA